MSRKEAFEKAKRDSDKAWAAALITTAAILLFAFLLYTNYIKNGSLL